MRNSASSATSFKWYGVDNDRKSICALVSDNTSKVDEFTNGQRVLKAAIEHLAGLPADWDNYGFEKISSATRDNAHNFVNLMLRKKKFPNAVTTDGIGGITFKWQWPSKKLLVTIKTTVCTIHLELATKLQTTMITFFSKGHTPLLRFFGIFHDD